MIDRCRCYGFQHLNLLNKPDGIYTGAKFVWFHVQWGNGKPPPGTEVMQVRTPQNTGHKHNEFACTGLHGTEVSCITVAVSFQKYCMPYFWCSVVWFLLIQNELHVNLTGTHSTFLCDSWCEPAQKVWLASHKQPSFHRFSEIFFRGNIHDYPNVWQFCWALKFFFSMNYAFLCKL